MTDTKSEAREFILVKEKLSNAALAFDLAFDLDPFIPQNWPPSSYVDTLHVIEKSAYAYAVDQWDYWVEEARKAQAKHERVLQALEVAETALEDFKLGHEHAPDLPHTRAMGDTYGWCDHCQTKVSWGPGLAEETLAKIEELKK